MQSISIEMPGPGRHADEDPRWRIFRKVTRVDRVDGSELLDRRAVHIALEHVVQRRPRRLDAKLELLQNELGLAFNGCVHDLAGLGIERRKARDIDRVAVAGDRRGRRLPPLQIGGQRLDTNDFPFHCCSRLLIAEFRIRASVRRRFGGHRSVPRMKAAALAGPPPFSDRRAEAYGMLTSVRSRNQDCAETKPLIFLLIARGLRSCTM